MLIENICSCLETLNFDSVIIDHNPKGALLFAPGVQFSHSAKLNNSTFTILQSFIGAWAVSRWDISNIDNQVRFQNLIKRFDSTADEFDLQEWAIDYFDL